MVIMRNLRRISSRVTLIEYRTETRVQKLTRMYISELPRMAVVPRRSDVSPSRETRVQKLTRMSIFGQGAAEDRLLEHRNSGSRFLTVREKHRLKIQAAEMFRQVQAGSRSGAHHFTSV